MNLFVYFFFPIGKLAAVMDRSSRIETSWEFNPCRATGGGGTPCRNGIPPIGTIGMGTSA